MRKAISYNIGMKKQCCGTFRFPSGKSGQAMVEYALVAVAVVVLLSVLAVLLHATRNQADRAAELVSSEYP